MEAGVVIGEPPLSIEELNKAFYEQYPRNYFDHVQSLIFITLGSTKEVIALMQQEQDVEDPVTRLRARMRVIEDPSLSDDILKSMKILMGSVYHHALETLMRLFWAHQREVDFPWLALSREFDFRKFKERKVTPLARLGDQWTGSLEMDERLRYVFATDEASSETLTSQLTGVKQWIRHAAIETLRTEDYNAFKHGLGLIVGTDEVQLLSRDRLEGPPIVSGEGDALVSLVGRKSRDGARHWSRRVKYLRPHERIGAIFVAQS